ncbi:hypothetical protein [Psychroflexus torquis]|uniref:hypothetical protein n=1 Tax=Psychroflexus torquis TaxID=57029 RepID=UPI0000D53E48|nr:hypothetical protein [Psychroflexus torquis]
MYPDLSHKAYNSIGRTVMYQKSTFLESENFKNKINLTSDDDNLLTQNIKNKSKFNLSLNPESFVLSQPKTTCKLCCKQIYYSTSTFYNKSSRLFLGEHYFSQFLFWSIFFILCLSKEWIPVFLIFGIAIGTKSLIAVQFQKVFKVPKSVLWIWPNFGAS